MPWETEIKVRQYGVTRIYRVRYADASPERAEAVAFFNNLGKYPWLGGLSGPPRFLDSMPIDEANAWLQGNPLAQLYDLLVSADGGPIHDDDLRRLEHLPELKTIHLKSDNITDAGVCHLRNLRQVESLGLYCSRLTDACLEVIRELGTLRLLDLQLSTGISRRKCKALVDDMRITEYFLPWPREKLSRFNSLWGVPRG